MNPILKKINPDEVQAHSKLLMQAMREDIIEVIANYYPEFLSMEELSDIHSYELERICKLWVHFALYYESNNEKNVNEFIENISAIE